MTFGAHPKAVRDKHMTREAAVDVLRGHLRQAIANQDFELCTLIGADLLDYCPTEAAEEIRTAFRLNLIEEFMFNERDLKRSLDDGLAGMQTEQLRLKPTGIPDTVAELEWWAGFQEPKPSVQRGSSAEGKKLSAKAPPERTADSSSRTPDGHAPQLHHQSRTERSLPVWQRG